MTSTSTEQQLWLIRESSGQIQGPLSFAALKEHLLSGQIALDSELCAENNYWFTFHDLDEMKLYFNENDMSQIFKMLRASMQMDDDENTKNDIHTLEIMPNSKAGNTQPSPLIYGAEKSQWLSLMFFVGLIAALVVVINILFKLRG